MTGHETVSLDKYLAALEMVRKMGEDLLETRDLLVTMADTLRGVLAVTESGVPYPWQGGALLQQIREDVTAFELLGLDWPVPEHAA